MNTSEAKLSLEEKIVEAKVHLANLEKVRELENYKSSRNYIDKVRSWLLGGAVVNPTRKLGKSAFEMYMDEKNRKLGD